MSAHTLICATRRPALIAAILRRPAPATSQQNICATSLAPAVLLHTVPPVNIKNFTQNTKTPVQRPFFSNNPFAQIPYSDVNWYPRRKAGQAVRAKASVVAETTPTPRFRRSG